MTFSTANSTYNGQGDIPIETDLSFSSRFQELLPSQEYSHAEKQKGDTHYQCNYGSLNTSFLNTLYI